MNLLHHGIGGGGERQWQLELLAELDGELEILRKGGGGPEANLCTYTIHESE